MSATLRRGWAELGPQVGRRAINQRRGGAGRKHGRAVLIYILAVVVAVETLAPFAWMVISSISTQAELISVPPHWIPEEPTLGTYEALLSGSAIDYRGTGEVSAPIESFGRALLNSFVIATSTTLLCLVLGTVAAFAFARFRFRFKTSLYFLILAVQMIPSISLVVPLYLLLRQLNLLDSYFGMTLVYSTFTVAFVIWVMTGYLLSIPRELEDAARIDGCTRFQALWQIVLPLTRPGLIATGALAFLTAWNEFLFALLFTNTLSAKTLPVVISEFSTQFSLEYGLMMTGGVLASLPPVLLAIAFQRHILAGLTAGGVKG
jgi:multiple sugar transport system permease protein